ncbi:MAG: hypothetical protein GF310_12060 [candidate division Zixibacteria bacterium]|nr:hypothetical protein [candidate division Zixibacteria bacterium]
MKKALALLIFAILIGCSSNGNGPDNDPEFTAAYFPVSDGDTWYYTNSNSEKIKREIDGDTLVNGYNCIRVLENGGTAEAWRIINAGDSVGFYVHMLTFDFAGDTIQPYFAPPLRIPFNMQVNDRYDFDSDGFYEQDGDMYHFDIIGWIVFEGFIDKSVPAGSFGDVARLHYYEPDGSSDTIEYYEYYAEGVGLLDNELIRLDSAFINGEWIR